MKLRLVILLILSSGLFQSLAVQAAIPTDIVTPQYRIDPSKLTPEWQKLFDELKGQGAIFGTFDEFRYLPLKKVPVKLSGEMRLSPDLGLSLHYLAPEDRMLVMDDKGMVMRDARGRSRELPSDARVQAMTSTLLHVMRFDFSRLTSTFDVYGVREGIAWRLVFEPRPDARARDGSLGTIIVQGQEATVLIIELRKSAQQRVEIQVTSTKINVSFTPEERKRFFR